MNVGFELNFFAVYLLAISFIACIVTAADKSLARNKWRRVPEKVLFLIAAAGGSAAMYITMFAVRHKTKHKRFMIGLPLIMLAQASAAIILKLIL
ncbi:MAG: DUF1294 domain-containing protein [Oscillospiraceae bacterium]